MSAKSDRGRHLLPGQSTGPRDPTAPSLRTIKTREVITTDTWHSPDRRPKMATRSLRRIITSTLNTISGRCPRPQKMARLEPYWRRRIGARRQYHEVQLWCTGRAVHAKTPWAWSAVMAKWDKLKSISAPLVALAVLAAVASPARAEQPAVRFQNTHFCTGPCGCRALPDPYWEGPIGSLGRIAIGGFVIGIRPGGEKSAQDLWPRLRRSKWRQYL
jgi:hypothetical protein